MDEKKTTETEEVLNEVATNAEDTPGTETIAVEAEAKAPAEEADEPVAEVEEAAPAEEPAPTEEVAGSATEAEAPTEAEEPAPTEEATEPRPQPKTKEEVVERLREIAHDGVQVTRPELEHLKQIYYHLHAAETAAARDKFVAEGGAPEDFLPEPDPLEEKFKAEIELIKELRAKEAASAEEQKQANLKRKLEIIELVKAFGESPETADKNFDTLKKLQAEWREIKLVPAENATELWKNYQLYIERFYDQLHLNHEARMYDFRKNLEKKLELCEKAERLAEIEDPITAFRQLQVLHQEYRETGPVERDKREEVWARFKEASTAVNKRHQAHFEGLKAQEEENLQQKTALCERMESIDLDALKTFGDWDKKTKEVLATQAEWKTIGFTPRKMNAKIFERFRAACDRFFQRKAEFFKASRETFATNLEAKNRLVEEAEALKESTDWNSTANKLIALQRKWKETGPVPHKVSEAVWKRFSAACNYFFEKKEEATGDQRREEEENLAQKNGVIAELEQLLAGGKENAQEAVQQAVHELQEKWNAIGHVPYRKKDKVYKKYREVLDRIYEELHISARRRSVENFRRTLTEKVGSELSRERQRLQTLFEAKKDEIQTYETNLSFFSSKSATGNSLVEEVQKKIARLKGDLEEIGEKLRAARQKEREEATAEKAGEE